MATKSIRYFCLVVAAVLPMGCISPAAFFSTKVNARITVSSTANPDANGRASPIVLRVYELKSPAAFHNPSFFSIFDEEATTLGKDLVAPSQQLDLAPRNRRVLSRKTNEATRYLAVVAAFRQIEKSRWYDVVELKARKTNKIDIIVGTNSVSIQRIK